LLFSSQRPLDSWGIHLVLGLVDDMDDDVLEGFDDVLIDHMMF
jgi:hypothetical protein